MVELHLVQWVTAAAAVVLAVITLAYVWYTRAMVREMRATRAESVLPALAVSARVLGVRFPIARIANVGPGYARNIGGSLVVTIGGEERWRHEWRLPVLGPGEFHDFIPRLAEHEDPLDAQSFADEGRRSQVDLGYEDVVGRRIERSKRLTGVTSPSISGERE